jgi:hypothetical protein
MEPPGAADGEAAAEGVGDAAADGLELGGVGDIAALGVPGTCAFGDWALPHAASNISATRGATRPPRFVTAIFKG